MAILPCVFSDEVAPEFDDAVRLAVEAGALGLELRNRMWGRSITQIDADDVARIQETCTRYGARVAVIGSPVGKCDMDNAEECRSHQALFQRMAQLAHAFETPLIRAFALWRPNRSRETDHLRPNLDDYLSRIVEFLGPIVEVAEREGVRFCLETEGACLVGTCAEARRVMDALGNSEALGLAWDVNNGYSCGELPYPDGYALIKDRVYHVHVKPDSRKTLDTVADSELTYEQILNVLKADGYTGWASIEHWGTPEEQISGVRQLAALLQRIN